MAGPIATATVDIIAKLRMDTKSDMDTAIRSMVNKIEGQLEALEAKGTQAARKLIKDFKAVNLQIGVRDAILKLDKVEDAAKETVSALKVLDKAGIKAFNTTAARESLRRLEDRVKTLDKSFKDVGDGKIRINVTQARDQLRLLEKSISSMQAKLADVSASGVDTASTRAAIADLNRLDAVVGELLQDLQKVNKTTVTVDVDDYKLDALSKKLAAIDRDIPIALRIEDRAIRDVDRTAGAIETLGSKSRALQQAFGSAFRRIIAFGAIQGAIQGISTLFRAGVQAAGAIQTVEVTLNRFFALTRDLGQTSGEFFNNLRNLALNTPFEFEGLADTSRRILAMGVDADETIEIMGDLTDAVSAVGGGQGEIDGVVRALSQLRSKGRVDLQDFRQISENLPSLSRQLQIKGIIDELNDLHPELKATTADFDKLRRSGLITGEVLTDGVLRAIKEIPGVAGAARAASRTLQGALSNLADFAKQEFAQSFGGLGGIIADELNQAFGSLTSGSEITPLAGAIRDVIDAFGRAGESNLPEVLQGVVDLAPGVSTLVESFSELVEEVLPALTNLSTGALTSITGVTGAIKTLVGAFGALPDGVQQLIGSFSTLALIIPGAGEALLAPFKKIGPALKGAEGAVAALKSSLATAGFAAVGLVAVQVITSQIAKATERSKEFKESISEGARSLKEFGDIGKAALDFVNKFRIEGEGANIGGLEELVNGLTSGELEQALKTTPQGLANLVAAMAELGVTSAEAFEGTAMLVEAQTGNVLQPAAENVTKAFREMGLSIEEIEALPEDVLASVTSLAEQFGEATKRQFDYAVSSQKFVFASNKQVAVIKTLARLTGDYAGGLEDLEKANQAGAAAAIEETRARGATTGEINSAIAANTTYSTALDGSTEATIDYVGALQDLNEALMSQETIFQGLTQSFTGFGDAFNKLISSAGTADLGKTFVDFAVGADKAKFSTEQLNAIANELQGTLGQAFSGEELQAVISGFVSLLDEFKGSLSSVIPGIDDLQFEADTFSLDKFIEELQRIGSARANVVSNVNQLLDEFGTLGSQFLGALIDSGLDKDTFAIAVEQALAGGAESIQTAVDTYGIATSGSLDKLAERLTARRFSQEEIAQILGTDAFVTGVGGLTGAIDGYEGQLSRLEALRGRGLGVLAPSAAGLTEAQQQLNNSLFTSGGNAVAAVPGMDTAAAVESATTAGDQVGAAYSQGVSDSIDSSITSVSTAVTEALTSLGTESQATATTAGSVVGESFLEGIGEELLTMAADVKTALTKMSTQASSTALKEGKDIGEVFARGFKQKGESELEDAFDGLLTLFRGFGRSAVDQMTEAGAQTAEDFGNAFDSLSDIASAELQQVLASMAAFAGQLALSGIRAGMTTTSGFSAGLNLSGVLRKEIGKATQAFSISSLQNVAFISGFQVGINFGRGMATGIASTFGLIAGAVATAIYLAEKTARKVSMSASPSKLFAAIGADIGTGLVVGVNATAGSLSGAVANAIMGAANLSSGGSTRSLAPHIASPGRVAALAPGSVSSIGGGTVNNWQTSFNIEGPVTDPETLAAQVAVRLERKMSR